VEAAASQVQAAASNAEAELAAAAPQVDLTLGGGGVPGGGEGPTSVTVIRNIKNKFPPGGEKV
jgi:outer membrane protein TolC